MHLLRIPSARAALAAVTLALLPAAGFAQLNFTAQSDATYGGKHTAIQATVTFESGPVAGTSYLTFSLKNLSDGLNNGAPDYAYGTLVGFGFNYSSSFTLMSGFAETWVAGADTTIDFTRYSPLTLASVTMDVGAQTDSPDPIDKGLDGGSTAKFQFQFAGTWTNANLTALFSGNEAASGDAQQDFYFRVQESGTNAAGGGSDKFFYAVPNEPIPEPSTYGAIAAAGLIGLVALRRRRQAAKR